MYFSLTNLNFFNTQVCDHLTSYKVLLTLIQILNYREHRLSLMIDSVKPLVHFSFDELSVIDVLLDNYLDSLDLTDELRSVLKARVSLPMLVKAFIYAFDCQWIIYRL